MKKISLKNSKVRLSLYGLVVGTFALVGIIVFISSQFKRAKYEASREQLSINQTNLEVAKALPDGYRKTKEVAWYTDLVNYFTTELEKDTKQYKAASIVSYLSTTLALVSFGICLKIEDDYKAKEDQ